MGSDCATTTLSPMSLCMPGLIYIPEDVESMGLENGKNDTIVLNCVTQFWVCVQQCAVCNKLKLVVNNCGIECISDF